MRVEGGVRAAPRVRPPERVIDKEAPMNWQDAYARALTYEEFLSRHGTEAHRQRWQTAYERVTVTPAQRALLEGFQREMHLLCLAGTWCGDCVREGAILQRISESAPRLTLRFLDRDRNPEVARALSINDGLRIPVVVFLSEDFIECARYGERTLATYRKMAAERLDGRAPGPAEEHYAAVVQDWMNEIERVQLLLRLSPRLRARHGD
jgi:thiol-disulfide isomerase/thioredoxin